MTGLRRDEPIPKSWVGKTIVRLSSRCGLFPTLLLLPRRIRGCDSCSKRDFGLDGLVWVAGFVLGVLVDCFATVLLFAVSLEGLFAGLSVGVVLFAVCCRRAYGSAVAGRLISGRRGGRKGPDLKVPPVLEVTEDVGIGGRSFGPDGPRA